MNLNSTASAVLRQSCGDHQEEKENLNSTASAVLRRFSESDGSVCHPESKFYCFGGIETIFRV